MENKNPGLQPVNTGVSRNISRKNFKKTGKNVQLKTSFRKYNYPPCASQGLRILMDIQLPHS
jgi:hypothetical protein